MNRKSESIRHQLPPGSSRMDFSFLVRPLVARLGAQMKDTIATEAWR